MQYVMGFFRFWYHFIVGDDWTVAAFVTAGLALTWRLAHTGYAVWWLMPLVAMFTLGFGLWRALYKG